MVRLVKTLELSRRIRHLNDAHEREAVALADGLVDLAEAFERFVTDLLPRLEAQTSEAAVDDAVSDVVEELREVVWHLWYSKLLRGDLLGPSLDLPWINRSLRP